MTARWPGEANVTNYDSAAVPKLVTIKRRNGVIYYSIAGSEETVFINTPASVLTKTFKPNLTFGASINSSGDTFRYFNGIVSNISVTLHNE